jgi:hypothetical protein
MEDLLSLAAVKNGALRTIPSALIQRRTPRILKGAERMCAILDGVRKTR